MKKILSVALAAILTLAASSAGAQTPFFLNKVGAEAEYAVKGPDGTVMSYVKQIVTAIDATDERNYTVSYTAEALNGNRAALAAPMTMTTVVKDGAVAMSPGAGGMEIEGTPPSYPADMSVGQTFEYSFTAKMMGMDAVTTGKEKVAAREEITTPAGTFDCFRIESDITVKVMGQTQNMKTVSWLSAGIGNVKSETRDGGGNVQMTQELVSLK